jgi:hypothetical protein
MPADGWETVSSLHKNARDIRAANAAETDSHKDLIPAGLGLWDPLNPGIPHRMKDKRLHGLSAHCANPSWIA